MVKNFCVQRNCLYYGSVKAPPVGGLDKIKMASYLHRTAQPSTLATFRSWGSSTGAGRIRLAGANIGQKKLLVKIREKIFLSMESFTLFKF
jgi:hypothetical protein